MCPSGLESSLLRFLVLQGVLQHLGYLLPLDSHPYTIWTVTLGICSGGYFWWFNIYGIFGGGSKVVGELNSQFTCNLALSFCPNLLAIYFIVTRFSRSSNYAVLLVVSWEFHLLFACFQGAPKLSEGLLHACKRCPGKYSTCILVLYLCDQEGLDGLYSLISDGIYLVVTFYPNSVEEDIIK